MPWSPPEVPPLPRWCTGPLVTTTSITIILYGILWRWKNVYNMHGIWWVFWGWQLEKIEQVQRDRKHLLLRYKIYCQEVLIIHPLISVLIHPDIIQVGVCGTLWPERNFSSFLPGPSVTVPGWRLPVTGGCSQFIVVLFVTSDFIRMRTCDWEGGRDSQGREDQAFLQLFFEMRF